MTYVFHKLGFQVYLSEIIHNGKLLHVKGYREEFKKQAKKIISTITELHQTGLPLISTETVTRLMLDMEYADILQHKNKLKIHSFESFIANFFQPADDMPASSISQPVTLLPHCMEQTSAKESSQHWQKIFEKVGVPVKVINAGCCGMSGLFGHEVVNNQLSENIFNLVWKPTLELTPGILLASGFSCRCQSKNHQFKTMHPAVLLAELFQTGS